MFACLGGSQLPSNWWVLLVPSIHWPAGSAAGGNDPTGLQYSLRVLAK